MEVIRNRSFRIYPNKSQIEIIENNFGANRFIYNHFLDIYLKTGKCDSAYKIFNEITALKKSLNYDWLNAADSVSLQESIKNMMNAIKRYEGNISGKPKRKNKKNEKQSYRTNNNNNNIRFERGKIKLPKVGSVKANGYESIEGKIICATVKRISDKYYCVLCILTDVELKELSGGSYTLNTVELPEFILESEFNCENDKYNRQVRDFLQKLSTDIWRENKEVYITKYINQDLSESKYNELIRMIQYKQKCTNGIIHYVQ